MAKTVDEINKIDEISKLNNLVAMVGHTFIFNQAVRDIKKYINEGILGDIRYIYGQRVNLGRIRKDVDALWNLAPHDISIVQYWLDEEIPTEVNTIGMDYVQDGINDVVFMNIKYQNKIMVNLQLSWLDPNKIRKLTIVGSKKMIVYDDIVDNKIMIYDKGIDPIAKLGEKMDFDKLNSIDYNHRSGNVITPAIDWTEPLCNEIDHFFDCIETNCDCLTGTSHAKNVIRILEMGQ